jgi:hypothetical protein
MNDQGEIGRRAGGKEIDFGGDVELSIPSFSSSFRVFHLNCFQRPTRLRFNGGVRFNGRVCLDGGVCLNGGARLMAACVRPSSRLMRWNG